MSLKHLSTIDGIPVVEFIPNPSYSQVTGSSASITIATTLITAIKLYAVSDVTYYFNSDTTKTFIIPAKVETVILTSSEAVTSITITNASTTAVYIQGM